MRAIVSGMQRIVVSDELTEHLRGDGRDGPYARNAGARSALNPVGLNLEGLNLARRIREYSLVASSVRLQN